MTTGTIGFIPVLTDLCNTTIQNGYYKTWNGSNGKYNADGSLKDNGYSMTSYTSDVTCNKLGYAVYGGWNSTDQWTDNDTLTLQGELISKVKEHQLHAGIALAQADKTLRMCVDTVTRFRRSLKALKRGNFAEAADALGVSPRVNRGSGRSTSKDNIAANWLELQYGWMPLLKDLYNASKALEASYTRPKYRIIHASRTIKTAVPMTYPAWGANAVHTEKRMYTYQLSEKLDVTRELGLIDPASVAWEIMPWSFVVDWFIPIGPYLEVVNQAPLITGKLTLTKSTRHVSFSYGLPPRSAGDNRKYYVGCTTHQEFFSMSRFPNQVLQVPLPNFKSLGKALSIKHLVNALALLVSVVK